MVASANQRNYAIIGTPQRGKASQSTPLHSKV